MRSWTSLLVKLASALTCLTLVGCQIKPTKVSETHQPHYEELVETTAKPLYLQSEMVILDARELFKYEMSHLPQASHIQWDDFSDPAGDNKGLLKPDLFRVARRLSTKGVGPDTEVVVVGEGKNGNGEEGRVAWTLLYLGVQKVHFADIRYFQKLPRHKGDRYIKNAKVWKPKLQKSLLVDKEDMKRVISRPQFYKNTFIIDVRSKDEYFNKGEYSREPRYPDINAILIHWKRFIGWRGRPNPEIVKQLEEVGISKTDRVIVISKMGLRSGAVTAALYSLGYKNVANYAGGYKDLFSELH